MYVIMSTVKRDTQHRVAVTKGENYMENTKNVVAKKEAKVAEKKAVEKFDYKGFAESIEKAFKSDKSVDVIADTNRETPKAFAQPEYRYIHFYNPGTEKDMFGMYLRSKSQTRFSLSLSVEDFLDNDLTIVPVIKKRGEEKRKIAIDVVCDNADAVAVAQKIISAYIKRNTTKAEAKAEKKPAAEKPEKKAPTKKAEPKKATVAKRPAKKAANK